MKMKNNIIKIPNNKQTVEQLSDIAYCKSIFHKHEYNMEKNFMNPDVIHAYQLVNIIRINSKSDEVYYKALEALAYYGDLLYGKDVRIQNWREQRLLEKANDDSMKQMSNITKGK